MGLSVGKDILGLDCALNSLLVWIPSVESYIPAIILFSCFFISGFQGFWDLRADIPVGRTLARDNEDGNGESCD